MKPKLRRRRKTSRQTGKRRTRPPSSDLADHGEVTELAREVESHPESSPRLTAGDLDADWQRAGAVGEEAVGGTVATPDQDVVDEIGRAVGVEQELDAEVRPSEEILRDRDRFRWHLEREAADGEDTP